MTSFDPYGQLHLLKSAFSVMQVEKVKMRKGKMDLLGQPASNK